MVAFPANGHFADQWDRWKNDFGQPSIVVRRWFRRVDVSREKEEKRKAGKEPSSWWAKLPWRLILFAVAGAATALIWVRFG